MDKPGGNAGRSRGRAQGNRSDASGGGPRGRRNPQSGGPGGQPQQPRAQPSNGGAQGQNAGRPVSAAQQPSAWGQGQGRGQPTSAAPQQPSAWGQTANRGPQPGQNRGQPTPVAPQQQSAWRQPSNNAGQQGQSRGQPTSTAPQQTAWRQPTPATAAGAHGQSGPPVTTVPQQSVPHPMANPQQQRPPAPVELGQSTSQRHVAGSEAAGGGAVTREDTRGSVRGRRVLAEIVQSRPRDLATKSGTTGNRISVQTNYFRILKKPTWSIHQYRVDFSPDVEMKHLRRAYLAHHKQLLGGYIFDGTLLFSTNHFIPPADNGQMEIRTMNREGETIQIKIKHVGIVDVTDIQQIWVLNLIVRRAMEGLNLQLVGRNFYDPVAKIKMDQYRMEIWPGYITSIRQHEQDILLCAEISHKVMRTETVYHILTECLNKPTDYQYAFKQQVVGSIVLTDYNNKTYRVDDVNFEASPMSKFPIKDGSEITYLSYYKQRYNIQIRDQRQPLLVSRPTEKNLRGGQIDFLMLVPELCRSTGLTDAMRNDFRLMRAMSEHTRLNPNRRIDRLRMFNNRVHNSESSMQVFASWNLQLDKKLVEVPGRVLPPESILFGNNKVYKCDQNADWTREFRNNAMFVHVDIKNWFVILPRRNLREVQEFVKMCIRAAASMKMHISEPKYQEMPDDRNGSYSQAIDKTTTNDPQLLMLVLPNINEEKYSCIKKKCCVDRPVPSQVVTLRTIAPRAEKAAGLMSIATKVVIQMNAKLMGAPWMINLPLPGLMTVGFDVCHSAKDKNKSFGAFVATMDVRLSTKYFSAVTQHMKGQEMSNEITLNMTCALKSYREVHGSLPQRIVFYRDGVSDGQLHQVYNTEVKFLKKKLDEIYLSAGVQGGCKLAFIVVTKRINTRYFVNGQNPVPGTVVDDIITLPERYDFFLVSQSVRQGTVSPTSYNVIHDTLGLSADKVQMLTYKMTHLYYNWSGTLSVPAVCQYAHKLAFLVSEYIHRAPSNALQNQLYFL